MIDYGLSFLLHHTPPPEFAREPVLFRSRVGEEPEVISLNELSACKEPIVTHSFSLLVDWFRRKSLPLPNTIIDLEVAKKLLIGRPKSDFRGEPPWTMAQMLLKLLPDEYRSDHVKLVLTTHFGKLMLSESDDLRWINHISRQLPVLWDAMSTELERKGEKRRFEDVEIPVYNAMLEAQYNGLRVDIEERKLALELLEQQYMSAHHELTIRKGVDVERAFVDFEYLLNLLDQPIKLEVSASVKEIIRGQKDSDQICWLLNCVEEARVNRRILFRMGGQSGLCFPIYDTVGTVSGRIIAIDPQLQYLKKQYRKAIAARSGYTLIYVDYSHFEPNIMASITNDPHWLNLCKQTDLYDALAIELLGDSQFRDTVKQLVLSYSYGMTSGGLVCFLRDNGFTEEDAQKIIITKLVPLFSGVEVWKTSILNGLLRTGRIETIFGSHRYRGKSGALDAKERRWAISQVIQGTGSLILKKAIIRIRQSLSEVRLLLPMHDALLVEAPEECVSEMTQELLRYLREAFLSVCPLSSASAKIKIFADAYCSTK